MINKKELSQERLKYIHDDFTPREMRRTRFFIFMSLLFLMLYLVLQESTGISLTRSMFSSKKYNDLSHLKCCLCRLHLSVSSYILIYVITIYKTLFIKDRFGENVYRKRRNTIKILSSSSITITVSNSM